MSVSRETLVRSAAVVVVCGVLISVINFGVRNTFGLFQIPMTLELGWTRETFAFALAVQNLLWGLGQPLAGAVADKFGTGRVIVAGTLVYAAGLYVVSITTTPFELMLGAGVLVGFGAATTGMSIMLAAVGRAVAPERRSAALGIVTAGGSFGHFILLPIGQRFIEMYGWQSAALLLGVVTLLVVPLALAFTGRPSTLASVAAEPPMSLGRALDEARRQGSYLLLCGGFFVCGFHVAFIVVHLPAYLVGRGLEASTAATAVAMIGLFNLIGAYGAGVLGGRFSKRYLLSMIYILRAITFAALIALPATPLVVMAVSGAIGLLWLSTVPLTSGLVAVMFGVRYMATLVGIVTLSHQVGAFAGVWLGGYVFDRTGSYDPVWWIGIALGLIAALVHLPIKERRLSVQPA